MRGGADRDENTSESLFLLYCLPSSLPSPPPSCLSPELCDRLSREGQVGRRRAGWGSGEGRQDPTGFFLSRGVPETAGVRLCPAGAAIASNAQASAEPRAARAGGREALGCRREEQPHAPWPAPFGPGLLSDSSATCLETPPAPDKDGKGARWVSSTSCCTVLRLACLQIHQIIHAKQPFRNHFLCFFETLLYSSICLI